MSRFAYTTQPVRTAAYIASVDTSSNASTDWTDLVSSDFKDSKTGSALAASLLFTAVTVHNSSTTASAFFKLRARGGAGDTTSAELEIPASSTISIDIAGLAGSSPATIAYKKGGASDELVIICGFELATV
jgi:hypothetical protein